jgi:N-acetylneuraminic acid mutarotase
VGSGATSNNAPPPGDSSEVYDPATGEWTGQTRLPWRGTWVRALVRLGETDALAIGGYDSGDTGVFTDVGFVYGAASNRWTQADFPYVFEPSFITLPDGDVLAVGGSGGGDCCRGIASVKDVYRFDHETLKWREVSPLPTPREAIALALLPDGRVLAAGGVRVRASDTGDDETPVKVTELYDPATDVWSKGPNLLKPGGGAIAVVLADGDVLLLGGSLTAPERLTFGP